MALSTGRGITYPETTDALTSAAAFQTLATTADTAVGVVGSAADALVAALAYAINTLTETISGSGASSYSSAYTFAVGRFTQPPVTIVTNNGGSGSSGFVIQNLSAPTTSGGTVSAFQRDGATATITALVVHILAVQMTSGSATG